MKVQYKLMAAGCLVAASMAVSSTASAADSRSGLAKLVGGTTKTLVRTIYHSPLGGGININGQGVGGFRISDLYSRDGKPLAALAGLLSK